MRYKRRLATIWFIGAGIVFVLILLQTIVGMYSGNESKVWGWFLPTIIPTLSLMVGVLVSDALHGARGEERQIDPFIYRLSASLSIAYFIVVLLTFFLGQLLSETPLKLLEMSNLWLAPLQGLVIASLAAFFTRAERSQ